MIKKHSIFEKAKTQLVINHPFYATIMFSLKVIETQELPDGRKLWQAATDGANLYVNPVNFNKLPLAEAVGVLKHECMHIALMHPWRRQGRSPQRWNHAADYVINDIIFKEKGSLPAGVLHSQAYAGMTSEQVYAQLPPDPPGGGGADHGNGNPLDDDLMDAPDQGPAAQAKAKATIAKAAQVAKAMGKLPAGIRELIDEVMNPVVAWQEQLKVYLTEKARSDYTFARPNRRFVAQGTYLPGLYSDGAMRKLVFQIDTSGSIGAKELRQFFGEVCGAVNDVCPSELIVIYVDADVNHVDYFERPDPEAVRTSAKRVGGGGTDMTVGLDWVEKNAPDAQLTIVLTDGYTPFGDERPNVLWLSTTDVKSPWGTTINVQFDER